MEKPGELKDGANLRKMGLSDKFSLYTYTSLFYRLQTQEDNGSGLMDMPPKFVSLFLNSLNTPFGFLADSFLFLGFYWWHLCNLNNYSRVISDGFIFSLLLNVKFPKFRRKKN